MNLIDKLAFISVKDQKVLCARSEGKDKFYIPGGKREPGESDQEGLIREVDEELGVSLDPATIRFYGNFEAQAHDKPVGVKVKMQCYTADYNGVASACSEIEEIDWLGMEHLEIVAPVDILIFKDLNKRGWIS